MPKRARSPLSDDAAPQRSVLPSLSRRAAMRRVKPSVPDRDGLLRSLGVSLVMAAICSFLSLREVLLELGLTCRAIADSLTPYCVSNAHRLNIIGCDEVATSLLADSDRSRALQRRITSLSLPIQLLRRGRGFLFGFLFSLCSHGDKVWPFPSLRRLFVGQTLSRQRLAAQAGPMRGQIGYMSRLRHVMDAPLWRSGRHLTPLLMLMRWSPNSFLSLARLHLEGNGNDLTEDVDLSSLSSLRALTHLRLAHFCGGSTWLSSLVAALRCLPLLAVVDMTNSVVPVTEMTQRLCSTAWPRWLTELRLPWFANPSHATVGWRAPLFNSFLCELATGSCADGGASSSSSSLTSVMPTQQQPPQLQLLHMQADFAFIGSDALLSLFRCYHLRALELQHCYMAASQFAAFCRQWAACSLSPPCPPLVSLKLPSLQWSDDADNAKTEASEIASHLPTLVSSLPGLRELEAQGRLLRMWLLDQTSACSASSPLHRLRIGCPAARLPKTTLAVRFEQLTELELGLQDHYSSADALRYTLCDAELESLLDACPHLLRLSIAVATLESWDVFTIAARCCPSLLMLRVRGMCWRSTAEAEEAKACSSSSRTLPPPFLPHLVALSIDDWNPYYLHHERYDFRHLAAFTAPPSRSLQRLLLSGFGLTKEAVLRLSCLPNLRSLQLGEGLAEVRAASRSVERQMKLTFKGALKQPRTPASPSLSLEGPPPPPLGCHQGAEMLQRALSSPLSDNGDKASLRCVLRTRTSLPADVGRSLFFAHLKSAIYGSLADNDSEDEKDQWDPSSDEDDSDDDDSYDDDSYGHRSDDVLDWDEKKEEDAD